MLYAQISVIPYRFVLFTSSMPTDRKNLQVRCDDLENAVHRIEEKLSQALETSTRKSSQSADSAVSQLQNLHTELQLVKTQLTTFRSDLVKLDKVTTRHEDIDCIEQYSRRNCLLIHGFPETPREDPDLAALEVLTNQLKLPVKLEHIDRCHRIGNANRRRNAADVVKDGPRPLIVKFTSYRYREMTWRKKKQLKGTKILITESLTVKRQKLLRSAREIFGVRNCFTQDGKICIMVDSRKVVINFQRELDELVLSRTGNTE